jgi:5-bromo-4-chloroindolyl phosphate hydrolysis protein
MLYIKKFIDKLSYLESKQSKDLVMPLSEARLLRDELMKIIIDYAKLNDQTEKVIEVKVKGGSFK